eukprot:UN02486
MKFNKLQQHHMHIARIQASGDHLLMSLIGAFVGQQLTNIPEDKCILIESESYWPSSADMWTPGTKDYWGITAVFQGSPLTSAVSSCTKSIVEAAWKSVESMEDVAALGAKLEWFPGSQSWEDGHKGSVWDCHTCPNKLGEPCKSDDDCLSTNCSSFVNGTCINDPRFSAASDVQLHSIIFMLIFVIFCGY